MGIGSDLSISAAKNAFQSAIVSATGLARRMSAKRSSSRPASVATAVFCSAWNASNFLTAPLISASCWIVLTVSSPEEDGGVRGQHRPALRGLEPLDLRHRR